jgi:hypothetical protein
MGEREAPDEDRAGGGRAIGVLGRVVDEGRATELARPRGHLGEPARAGALQHDSLAERRDGEALPVGLFEACEAVVGAPGRENGGAHVELARHRDRDRGDGGVPAAGPGICDGALDPAAQPLRSRGVERQTPAVRCDANAHA